MIYGKEHIYLDDYGNASDQAWACGDMARPAAYQCPKNGQGMQGGSGGDSQDVLPVVPLADEVDLSAIFKGETTCQDPSAEIDERIGEQIRQEIDGLLD